MAIAFSLIFVVMFYDTLKDMLIDLPLGIFVGEMADRLTAFLSTLIMGIPLLIFIIDFKRTVGPSNRVLSATPEGLLVDGKLLAMWSAIRSFEIKRDARGFLTKSNVTFEQPGELRGGFTFPFDQVDPDEAERFVVVLLYYAPDAEADPSDQLRRRGLS
jgi:hypothetical protein